MAAVETDFQQLRFGYQRSADQDAVTPVRRPVVVVGAGPVGLSLAIDLAQRGVPVVLLDEDSQLSAGSRAICFAKRTLEIFDRLGVGERVVAKGVKWNVGKVFFGNEEIYRFDLLPEPGHERPAFVNLPQHAVEGYLVERAAELPELDLRWHHRVTGIAQQTDHVRLTVSTPEGDYTLEAEYVAACDGARSPLRQMLGQESSGRVFRDRFLIADVRMKHAQPAERWFWFDPPFHPGQSVLLHMQPDGIWRIDFQLGWDADPEVEKRPENVLPRVRALLGEDQDFTLEWASVYTFACRRMPRFRHGRVLFAGDSAHGVSPFGARGANSGVQDADNLAWKLAAVLQGWGSDALLDSYADEREAAADENILNSTRSTDFITPKSEISRVFRDAVLQLAKHHPFARSLVNSGRLSLPSTLTGSTLNTASETPEGCRMVPGAPAADAPLQAKGDQARWLLRELAERDRGFTLLVFNEANDWSDAALRHAAEGLAPLQLLHLRPQDDTQGLLAQRYALLPGSALLLRPDQHLAARWERLLPDAAGQAELRAALQRALAR
ncbi:FAD-dependent oxidoreductase [Ideonella azotifigens]|uniref:FAD-dependent oxidoreductase n=1 Tax=Ideonella azotifigens TaxID=513160 RepID=A0ABN1JSI9_9BURK|nr:FAD-dependent oxidoreductase [Ideonella azotifigens]MCD2340923.1 FAD-dependent oxidoreductase [Ideonella azotifigens]